MGDWFLGEIRIFPYGFTPVGWKDCDGTILNIAQNQALFSIISNAFGGNGTTTFALPDLRGRVAVHPNPVIADVSRIAINLGKTAGEENHILTAAEVASHTHVPAASNAVGTTSSIATTAGNYWAAGNATTAGQQNLYGPVPTDATKVVTMGNCVKSAGGGQGHSNMQPFQTLRYCIAVQGIYPSHQ